MTSRREDGLNAPSPPSSPSASQFNARALCPKSGSVCWLVPRCALGPAHGDEAMVQPCGERALSRIQMMGHYDALSLGGQSAQLAFCLRPGKASRPLRPVLWYGPHINIKAGGEAPT